MAKKQFYITTAIPYVNAEPHIGFALEAVQTDAVARYHRLLGEEVFFLTGTDENALKNVQAAEEAGIPIKQLIDKNSAHFYQLKSALNLSFDDFIRTTEKRHIKGAQKLWQSLRKSDVYKKKYRGLYCVGCEVFYTKKDLIRGRCPEHQTVPEVVEEENYFFRLSSYQDWLEKLISKDRLKIIPETRKNEVLAFIRRGLEDFSISRSVERAHGWGVPVPGDPNQIIYVWVDALSNYITALGYGQNGKIYQKFWADNPNRVHLIGKGITRFHAIYWPAILRSAGIPLPTVEFVHGYVTVDGQKISKSLGNVIDPFALVEKYGTDPIRYYLLREIPAYGDGDFSERRFREIYNADLANGLGNLVARVAKLAEGHKFEPKNLNNIYYLSGVEEVKRCRGALDEFRFDQALEIIWRKISRTDKYVDTHRPWQLEGKKKTQALTRLREEILAIGYLLGPFLPQTTEKIEKQFSGPKVRAQKPLFPRISG